MSTANISQLAVDLLVVSLSLKKIGIFNAKDLVPVVGGREDGEEGITTPLECMYIIASLYNKSSLRLPKVYGRDGVDIVIIQQRSPVIKVGYWMI